MCIRDSLCALRPHAFDQRAEHVGVVAAHVALVGDARQPAGCLLYTSDAADERSSVDLGGRRIIKKKNKSKI